MRDIPAGACFFFGGGGPSRPGRGADLSGVAGLTSVSKSAGHQLASLADLPTTVSWLVG